MSGQPETDDRKNVPGGEQQARDGANENAGIDPGAAERGADEADLADSSEPGDDDAPLTTEALLASLEKERLRQDAEIETLKDRVLRTHAEMENLRKRAEREKQDASKYAITKFAMDVVSIADNLQRAMDAAGTAEDHPDEVKGLFEGVALTAQELQNALDKHNVKKIEAHGQLFDPHLHQAMMEQPDPEVVSGTILKVFQEGYMIGDRVLRPSMVVVARGGPKPDKQDKSANAANRAGRDSASDADVGARPDATDESAGDNPEPTRSNDDTA